MDADIIKRAKEYINSHLSEQFTLEDVAKFFDYSVYHFSREFHKYIDLGVMEFVCKERIASARIQLLSEKSIYDVALRHGFETHTGFTNAFFRYTGCNPSSFRKHEQKHDNYIKGEILMKDETVIIRKIEINDVNDMWENVFSRNTPTEIKERIQRDLEGYEEKTQFHVVLEVDGTVVGTLGLTRSNKYSFYANLGDFVIHPDYQGKGYARKMIDKVKELVKDTNISMLQIQCRSENLETKNKYISLGFSEVYHYNGFIYFMMGI